MIDVEPTDAVVLPDGHAVHDALPVDDLYVPIAHAIHTHIEPMSDQSITRPTPSKPRIIHNNNKNNIPVHVPPSGPL
jgi:hypothetical protein